MGRTGQANSQAANDWAARKQQALEHARQLRATREAAAEAKYSSHSDAPQQPAAAAAGGHRAPMDALDQYMNHGDARNVCTPNANGRQHHQPMPAHPHDTRDQLESFMGHQVPGHQVPASYHQQPPDILGGLEHIGASARSPAHMHHESHHTPSYAQTCEPAEPQQQLSRQVSSESSIQLTRQGSLALLKKRNPNATRRPRPPKVPAQVLDAARCSACGQLARDCVDCNYCHALFCRDHFEEAASNTGRCPSCDHRCSSYDCAENVPMQRMIVLIQASIAGELTEPAPADSPGRTNSRRPSVDEQHRPSGRALSRGSSSQRRTPRVEEDYLAADENALRGFGGLVNEKSAPVEEESYAAGLSAGVRRKSRPTPARESRERRRAPPPEYGDALSHRSDQEQRQDARDTNDRFTGEPMNFETDDNGWGEPPPRKPAAAKPPKKQPAVKKQSPPREQPPPMQQEPPPWNDVASAGNGMPAEAMDGGPPPEMAQCAGCSRKFRIDVLRKHEPKCLAKANAPKRKVFDAKKQALVGTGAEKFIDKKKPIGGKSQQAKSEDMPVRKKVPKWKQQSEDLKNAMRAEKEYKAAVKAGKPPPPPPAATVDQSLVPCPHCGRSFNETAAERHIPKCATQKAKPTRLIRGGGNAAGNNALAARKKAGGASRNF